MKTYKKIFIGGLGALTPIIMNLLVIDLEVLLINLTFYSVLGYTIRVIVLFYLGGLIAFLHKDEINPVKIFELGIVAPALITALLNAGQIDVSKMKAQNPNNPIGSISFVSAAYAQTSIQQDSSKMELKTFSMPEETKMHQFWRGAGLSGLFGLNKWRGYFVIVGSHENVDEARQQVKQILHQTKEFKPMIYEPFKDRKGYSVVIGAHLSKVEAIQLEKSALDNKISKTVVIWNMAE
ncbi:MAG TPA: hypothetical protein VGD14_00155 [bacterium]